MASKLGLGKTEATSNQICHLTKEEKRQAKNNVKNILREIN